MTNLKCHEYSCRFNNCSHCTKDDLLISNDAYCKDFVKRSETDNQFEFSNEGRLSLKQDDHLITCNNSSCLNNKGGECAASYIRIDHFVHGAKCCQVREK